MGGSVTVEDFQGAIRGILDPAMDKTVRRYSSFEEIKADEYRYWQSRPVYERMDAVAEIIRAAYAIKGAFVDVPRLQGPLIRLQRPRR